MFEDHSTELLKFVLFLLLYAAGQHKTYEVYIIFLFLCSGVVGTGLAVLSKYRIADTFFHKFLHNGYFWDVFHGDWFAGKGLGCAIVEHPLKRIHLFNTHVRLSVSLSSILMFF